MSLRNLRAHFECDSCGCEFRVEVDPATPSRKDRTFFDIAVDEVRGGLCEVTAAASHMRWANVGMCSVQEGKHLCPSCTRKADEQEEDNLP